ncbi:MlaA family lipoprotein [Roseovarius salinarum]|uniref:MlaA family lipoprotein n=1 Tax=Roseovarius salinarum TaxID=1981892 RepID=UPI001E593FF8|nr:VacJ family lipoprotein [Roseovarius salinarum]
MRGFAAARIVKPAIALAGVCLIAACTARPPNHPAGEPFDPYEQDNRFVYDYNRALDRTFIRPVAIGYAEGVPVEVQEVVGNFSDNLSLPGAVVNNVLQANMRGAFQDTFRFTVNTTLGIGGLLDPATGFGMAEPTDADFGQTLHVWGVREGAYLVVPVTGPSTERAAAGRFVDLFLDPLSYVIPTPEAYYGTGATVLSKLGDRGRRADTIDSVLYESADGYAQLRSLYLQNRRFELGNGDSSAYLDPYDDPYAEAQEDPYAE